MKFERGGWVYVKGTSGTCFGTHAGVDLMTGLHLVEIDGEIREFQESDLEPAPTLFCEVARFSAKRSQNMV